MSAFNMAALVIFSGLGLTALAIGLLSRSYSTAALVTGLGGLFAIASATTWITVAGPIPELSGKRDTMPAAAPLAIAQTGPSSPQDDDLKRLRGELALMQAKAAGADKTAAAATANVAGLKADIGELTNERDALRRKVEELQKTLGVMIPQPPSSAPPDAAEIRRRLASGDGQHYVVRSERALIGGNKGTWYVIQLLQGGKTWNFADRQFALPDAAEIRASATRLRDDVLLPLAAQAKREWRLYVRGSADARRVAGPVGRELEYLPLEADGTYSLKPRGNKVIIPVQNEELPVLRADWLRGIVRPVLGQAVLGQAGTREIPILENPPQAGHGRTAELILFVAGE